MVPIPEVRTAPFALSMLIAALAGSVGLWGYVLGAIMSIKGATNTLALAAGSLVAARAGVDGPSEELPLWLALSGANLTATGLLLGSMRSS